MAGEMIEKVARACATAGGNDWDKLPDKHGPGFSLKQMYRGMARAAIKALREPTKEMRMHEDCDRWLWSCHTCGGPRENWELFIDAALRDE